MDRAEWEERKKNDKFGGERFEDEFGGKLEGGKPLILTAKAGHIRSNRA